ncbi:MAG TPA: DUF1517 domain-containing protein [Bacilli bacterium]|nr:DUF1517 domain-containing protein [Bacilli bacterium]
MVSRYYDLCCRYRGRYVNIYDHNGVRYYGRIVDVDDEFVWLDGYRRNRIRGFGSGFGYYPGWYYPGGFVFPLALGAIGGLALASLFFLW